ncbi:hypothetical protein Pelo_15883 [Pelomyxa schiedti]|nr:hypothetical protein Pelo_15883 [Pelomyxa schiedti]
MGLEDVYVQNSLAHRREENKGKHEEKSEAEIQQLEQVKSIIQAGIESMNAVLEKHILELLFCQQIVQHKIFDIETDLRVNTASIEERLAKAEQSVESINFMAGVPNSDSLITNNFPHK